MHTRQVMMGMLLVGLIGSGTPVLAANNGQQGASASAYQHASDQAVFHRIGDWFATLGKSGLEKDSILAQRRTTRVAKRAQKAVEHQAQQAEHGLREAGKGLQQGLQKGRGSVNGH